MNSPNPRFPSQGAHAHRFELPVSWLLLTVLAGVPVFGQTVVRKDHRINDENAITTVGIQANPDIAASQDGYSVVWRDDPMDGSGSRIHTQLFDERGNPAGASVKLNDDDESENVFLKGLPRAARYSPDNAIGAPPSGKSVYVWEDAREEIFGDVFGQIYDHTNGRKVGKNFRLNAFPAKRQGEPAIAMWDSGNGNFVVVWTDNRSGDNDIYARRFSADGTPSGVEFKVNDDSGVASQTSADVGIDALGNFVVVWKDFRDVRTGLSEVWAQRFRLDGSRLGDNFQVDKGVRGAVTPRISVAGDGQFVVAYVGVVAGGRDVLVRRYTDDGNPDGEQVTVSAEPGLLMFPTIAFLSRPLVKPSFVVTWSRSEAGKIAGDVVMQFIDDVGKPIGANTLVSIPADFVQERPAIASIGFGVPISPDDLDPEPIPRDRTMIVWKDDRIGDPDIWGQLVVDQDAMEGDNFLVNGRTVAKTNQDFAAIGATPDGRTVVIWQDDRNAGSGLDVYGKRFDSDGYPLGGDFKLSDDPSAATQAEPDVAVHDDGSFVAIWTDYRNDQDGDIFLQRFDSSGVPAGPNQIVHEAPGPQRSAAIDMGPDGAFVIAWLDARREPNGQVYARRFDPGANPLGVGFRVDSDRSRSMHRDPAVAVAADGSFAVVWADARGGDLDIWAQRYRADGSTSSGNFRANSRLNAGQDNIQMLPGIDIAPGGHLLVSWLDYVVNPKGDIWGHRYNSEGRSMGLFQINDVENVALPFPFEFPFGPTVASLPATPSTAGDNTFIVTWTDFRNGDQDPDIFAQFFSSGNTRVGRNVRVDNAPAGSWQSFPDVARDAGPAGLLHFSWTDQRALNTEGNSIWGNAMAWAGGSSSKPDRVWPVMAKDISSLVLWNRGVADPDGSRALLRAGVTWSTEQVESPTVRAELSDRIRNEASEGAAEVVSSILSWGPIEGASASQILADIRAALGGNGQAPIRAVIGERLWVAVTPAQRKPGSLDSVVDDLLTRSDPIAPAGVVTASLSWGTVDRSHLLETRMSDLLVGPLENPDFAVKDVLIFSPTSGLTPRIGLAAAYDSATVGRPLNSRQHAMIAYTAVVAALNAQSLTENGNGGTSADVFFDVFVEVDLPENEARAEQELALGRALSLLSQKAASDGSPDAHAHTPRLSMTPGSPHEGTSPAVRLALPTHPDADAFVEFTDDLSTGQWHLLPGAPHNSGSIEDQPTTDERYYRLHIVRPAGF